MAKASTSKRKRITEAKSASFRRSKRLKESNKSFKPSRLLMEREVKFSEIDDNSLNSFNRLDWGIMYKDFSTPKMSWVKEFYENFRNKHEHSVETTVEGVRIHLTPKIIATVLNLSLIDDISSKGSYLIRNNSNRDEITRFFTGDSFCPQPKKATTLQANKFVNPVYRLGMNIMNTNLFPTANRTELTLRRMFFLYDMFNNRPIDLPYHLFHVMCHASVKSKGDVRFVLPFPSLVTKLLSHKDFNVPEPEYFKPPSRQKPFNKFSLEYSRSHLRRPVLNLERLASDETLQAFQDETQGSADCAAVDAFLDEMPQHFNSMETGTADPIADDTVTLSRHNLSDEALQAFQDKTQEGADHATVDAFLDEMPQHFNSMETEIADPTADDTVTVSRHNLSDNMGDPLCSSFEKKLLIVGLDGLLLAFRPIDNIKTFGSGEARRLNVDLYFCSQVESAWNAFALLYFQLNWIY
nr:hypothetical protein CFP56_55226 [Quercus suber]